MKRITGTNLAKIVDDTTTMFVGETLITNNTDNKQRKKKKARLKREKRGDEVKLRIGMSKNSFRPREYDLDYRSLFFLQGFKQIRDGFVP